MAERAQDWLNQAERDLRHAEHALAAGDHEWACFAAHQAAEKAATAVRQHLHGEGWGHSVSKLLEQVAGGGELRPGIRDAALRLDRLYIPTRYPNGLPSGSPGEFFTAADSRAAIADARGIVDWCRERISGR